MSDRSGTPANAGLDGEGYYAGLDRSEEGDGRVETVRARLLKSRDQLLMYTGGTVCTIDYDLAALDSLAASLAEALEEAEALERMGRSYNDLWRQEKDRAEAAEARVAALEDALGDLTL